jgi:hypothetical protein
MKSTLISVFFLVTLHHGAGRNKVNPIRPEFVTENIFIITLDGFRWQEVFFGADSLLITNQNATPDQETIKALYWAATPEERRKKLLPFLWAVVSSKGQLYGNRRYDNRVNVANAYAKSYPGYSEIFTGSADPIISSNDRILNPNINVLEYLDQKPGFKGRIAVFTSWDVFPYIFNEKRNGLTVNSGYEATGTIDASKEEQLITKVQEEGINDKTGVRYDGLTFITAKEYIKKNKPRVVYLGLGETDEAAHEGRYDLYLEQASKADQMIAELWHWVQTTQGYKNNTTFIITSDHGRGGKKNNWTSHGKLIKGSSQTWLAVLGPKIKPLGEVKEEGQLYQQQLAQTIAQVLGEDFTLKNAAPPISLR